MLGDTDVCHLGEGGVKCRSLSKDQNNAADAPRVLHEMDFKYAICGTTWIDHPRPL